MNAVLSVAALAAGSLVVAWWVVLEARLRAQRARELKDGLARASRELGIRFAPRPLYSMRAKGTLEDFTLDVSFGIERDEADDPQECLRLSVTGPRLPPRLSFGAERGRGDDVLTGDPAFDDAVEVNGEPSVVLALLRRDLRRRVAEYVGAGGRLEAGRLTLRRLPASIRWDLLPALRSVVDLARELVSAGGGGIPERLASNARADASPGVRLWNLLQLQEAFAGTPEARDASRAALADASCWMRLSAARFLRDAASLVVLEALARDRSVAEQAAGEAVALLAARQPGASAGPILVSVLKGRSGDVRRQAVEELGRLRHAPALGPLIVLLERAEPRTAAAAATAVGALGDVKAEASLLRAAASDARELRLAAAAALGRVGSVHAVEPLLALLDRGRLDAETRQGLRDAIAAIQARLAGAGAGQLSLVPSAPESGRLSLATPRAGPGDLSLAPDLVERDARGSTPVLGLPPRLP